MDLENLNQSKDKLQWRIKKLMQTIKPLKEELETVTAKIYFIECKACRELPVWELRINPAKTLREAAGKEKITLCSDVTWQQMYDIATKYFTDNEIEGWEIQENYYGDCGQFHYKDGYNGGPILGVFEITKLSSKIIHAFDFEED
jgi:hypothetical protein